MLALELACVAILALWLVLRLRAEPFPGRLLVRLALLGAGAWIAEDTAIHLYAFYAYDPSWNLFVDRVPLMVALIWPAVIVSAWDLARCFVPDGGPLRIALGAGLLVFTDASLVEPVAVASKLWWWTSDGAFSVPIIGILGWAFFATAAVWLLELDRRRRGDGTAALLLVVAPLFTHALLLATWWGLLRWVPRTPPDAWAAVLAWGVSAVVTARVVAGRRGRLVPPAILLTRTPPAIFFFVLLLMNARGMPALMAYAFAFAPPYLALLATRRAPAPAAATDP